MAIENTYLLGKNITLGCGFDLQAKAPLDSRQTVPSFEGLRALIIGDAAYEGMIVYDEGTKKTYQAQKCESYSVEVDGKTKTYDIAFREFGINESELKELIASETTAAMEFKGATAALPENPAKGDMWKVTASFEVAGENTKVGDSIVYNGEEWFRIPSGDDIEDTWRIVKVDGTSLGGISEGKELNLTAGDKLDVTINTDGAVVYSHEAIDAPELLAENEQTRTYITAVETDGYGHITGYKTATENVEDSNTTYEFEGLPVGEDEAAPSSVYFQVASKEKGAEAGTPEVIYLDTYSKNEADAKFVESVSIASPEEGKVQLTVDGTAQTAVEINGFADLVAKKHSHTFVESELNKIADGDVAKWNTAAGKADTAMQPDDFGAFVRPGNNDISFGFEDNKTGLTKFDIDVCGGDYIKITNGNSENEFATSFTISADIPAAGQNTAGLISTGEIDDMIASRERTIVGDEENTDYSCKYIDIAVTDNGGSPDVLNIKLTDSAKASLAKADSAVQAVSLASGTNNGTVKLTVDDVVTDNIAVTGLGSAAYTEAGAYATAAQGAKADTALQPTAISNGLARNMGNNYVDVAFEDEDGTGATITSFGIKGEGDYITVSNGTPNTGANAGGATSAAVISVNIPAADEETEGLVTLGAEGGAELYGTAAALIEEANLGQYAKSADLGDLAALDTITADKVTDFATEVAKVKVNEAVKATQDGNGNVIADTYAEKANTYTKSEVEALLTWGSF